MNGASFAAFKFDSNLLVQLQHKFDLPSGIKRQRLSVSENAVLNTRCTQFINHANYKIIDSNVMDCANVTKIPTPLSAKRYFLPWWACAVQGQFRDREWWAIESHCWHCTAWWKCVFRVSWTPNINTWDANCLFAINAQCLKKMETLRDEQPIKERKTRRALYFGISPASPTSN